MDNRFPWMEFPQGRTVFTGCNIDQSKEVRRIGQHVCHRVPGLNWTWNSRSRSVSFHYGDDLLRSAFSFPLFADGVGDRASQAELDTVIAAIRRADRPKEEKLRDEEAKKRSDESDKRSADERRVSNAMPEIKDGLAYKDRARRGMKKLILPGGDL